MLAAAASVFGLGLLLERGIARKLQGAVDEAMLARLATIA
jgi:hypothetical protein